MVITRKIAIQTLRELVNKQHTWSEDFGGEYSIKVEKVLIYAADELELLMMREGNPNEEI